MINYAQREYIDLIQLLSIRAEEYRKLCHKFNKIKQGEIVFDDDKLLKLKALFKDNYDEICDINKRLSILKEKIESEEKERAEKYSVNNLFKSDEKIKADVEVAEMINENKKENLEKMLPNTNKSFLVRLVDKIKSFFTKK